MRCDGAARNVTTRISAAASATLIPDLREAARVVLLLVVVETATLTSLPALSASAWVA
jgi:hypothetical protein